MKPINITTLFFPILLISSCSGTDTELDNSDEQSIQIENSDYEPLVSDKAVERNGITITPLTNSPTFDNARLSFGNLKNNATIKAGKRTIKMDVSNYELGIQTSDSDTKNLANSDKGQHMHLILNNEPYMAHYDPEVEVDLKDGHYVALAFFSRSYHESVKSNEAYDIIQFNVGEASTNQTDLEAPHIFYSRPKGTYSGPDSRKILFDFYLLNTTLSEAGNKVRLTLNDETTFMIAKWQAYTIEGLPMGKNTFKIELLGSDGELIDTPFNPTERTIILEEKAS